MLTTPKLYYIAIRESIDVCSDRKTRDQVYDAISLIVNKNQFLAIGLSLRTTTGLKLEICYE